MPFRVGFEILSGDGKQRRRARFFVFLFFLGGGGPPGHRFRQSTESKQEPLWLDFIAVVHSVVTAPLLQLEQLPSSLQRIVRRFSQDADLREAASNVLYNFWCVFRLRLSVRRPRRSTAPQAVRTHHRAMSCPAPPPYRLPPLLAGRTTLGPARDRIRRDMLQPVLQVTTLLHPSIREVGVDMLYELLWLEYQRTPSFTYVLGGGSRGLARGRC